MKKQVALEVINKIQSLFNKDFLKHPRHEHLLTILVCRDFDIDWLIDELAFGYHPDHNITLKEILDLIEQINSDE